MKNVFERLLTGFISSLMVMSFILMPIPRLSIATATENNVEEECKDYAYQKGDIYKPGCELDAALTTTSFDSSTRYSEDGDKIAAKIPGMIEQYIVALTGVILINSLNWKRLHMYNPLAYGNDCPSNLIGKMGGSMALGAASGLSNTIGDLVSNVKFQGIAKDAAAHVARIKNNPIKADESTDEDQENKDAKAANNLQIESFNALIALMEGQNDAIQFKKKAAGLSALGFGLADGVEIANMIMMNGVCNIEWGKRGLDKTENASLRTAAESAKAGAIAQNLSYGNAAGASACKLASAAGSKKAIVIGSTEVLEATNSIDEARKVIKNLKGIKGASDILLKFTDLPLAGLSKSIISMGKDLGSEALDLALEQTDEGIAIAKSTAVAAAIAPIIYADKGANLTAKTCSTTGANPIVFTSEALASISDATNKLGTVQCCGGTGMSVQITQAVRAGKIAIGSTNPGYFVKEAVIQKAKETAVGKFVDKTLESIVGIPSLIKIKDRKALKAMIENGSHVLQGVPLAPGVSSYKKDIKILNLFGNLSANYSPKLTPQKLQEIKDLKFFFKNSFEAQVRTFAQSKYNFDSSESPQAKLERFLALNKQVDGIMHEFSNYVEEDFYYLYNDGLPNSSHPTFRKVLSKITDLIVPKAHAGIGATLMAAAPGLIVGAGAKMIKGPWSSVLKLGGNILMLHGLLGKFLKRTGLTSPIGRTITWASMSAMAGVSYGMTKNALEKNQKNLDLLIAEKEKFEKAAGGIGVIQEKGGKKLNLGFGNRGDGVYSMVGKLACVKKSAGGYSPIVCGKVQPKRDFQSNILNAGANRDLNSLYLNGASTLSDFNTLAANGKIDSKSFDQGTFEKIETLNNAIRAKNDKHRKQYDKQMKSGDKEIAKRSGSLQTRVAKIRKALLKNSQFSGGSPFLNTQPLANTDSPEDKKKDSKPNGSMAAISNTPIAPVSGGMDFDFDSDDEDSYSDLSDTSDKKAVSIDEYVVKHDDISKKKDVSIFRILSKRYIMSYPKFMKEKQ